MKVFPLSNAQLRLLPTTLQFSGSFAYQLIRTCDFPLKDEIYLPKAVQASVPSCFRLRLTQNEQGDYEQYIGEPLPIAFEDISGLPPAKAQAIINKVTFEPYPGILDQPLARITLVKKTTGITLIFHVHHIIADGTSMYIFYKDILQNLTALKEGKSYTTEKTGYQEYVFHEIEYLKSEKAEQDKTFWINNLSGLEEYPTLPAADISFPVPYIDFSFTEEESRKFLAFCDTFEKRISPFILASSLFAIYLARVNRTPDVVLASGMNARPQDQKGISGMCVNTVPLKYPYKPEQTVREAIAEAKYILKQGLTHCQYPFNLCTNELVKADIQPESLFSYSIVSNSIDIPGKINEKEALLLPFTVRVNLAKKDEQGLQSLRFVYNKLLFTENEVRRMFACLRTMLIDAVEHPDKACGDLEMLSPEETELLDSFNKTEFAYDTTQSIVSLFRNQVAETPDNIAVVYKEKHYTYQEVDRLSECIGQHIKSLGLKKEQAVSILIPRCEYMAIASLGVLKAGCAYQPLDPSYPMDRLAFMMKDTDAQLLIADESLIPLVPDYKGEILLTKDIPSLPDKGIRLEDVCPENLFIFLYTSGSTGVPKGCMLEHRNLVAFCNWYQRYYELKLGNHVAAYASYGFDASMMDTYPALTCGATMHIIGEDIRLDLIALNEYFEKHKITHSFITTQVGRQFALEVENHSLKHLSIGGEKLVPLTPPANYHFHNAYGPTECTIYTTVYQLTKNEENIPIGKPLDNLKLYIADPRGHRLPAGATGELWVAGIQVSRGYLNRPEETAKAYIPNPFDNEPGYERIYRTGDIVRYLPDGNIAFVGRKDAQVKIRGFRIELTEVEAVIREFPGIKDATVQAFDEEGGGKFIAAYIVSDQQVDIEALNDFILDTKPPYMVPAVTMQIDKIPLNQNQKVNKKALPVPEKKASATEEIQDNRPLNVLEEELMEIVAGIIHTTEFGVTSKLGYVGLTSISAIKLATVVYKKYGVTLDSKTLVKSGTIQDIENEVIRHLLTAPQQVGGKDKTSAQKEYYPLSYSQSGVYYECMKRPTETVYNIPFILTYPLDILPQKLVAAAAEVVEAHPHLMTHFEMRNEDIVQVYAIQKVSIPEILMNEEEFAIHKKEFVKPFNLMKGPLYRLGVVRTEEHTYLLLDFHHLVFDGASCDLFINTLNKRLEGEAVEKETYSYFEYADDEKNAETSAEFEASRIFFDNQLKTCEGASEISSDLNGNPENGSLAECLYPVDHAQVDAFCKSEGITPAQLFLAGAFYTISRYVNNKQVYISTISNGRSNVKIANTTGMFVKTLPLAATIGEQTVEAFLKETGRLLDDTLSHENYPFAKLAAEYNFKPEIMYAYQVGVLNRYTTNGQPVGFEIMELKVAKFKLSIHIEMREDKLCIVLQYNDAVYSKALMDGFAEAMATVISHMMENSASKTKSVSMLSKHQEEVVDKFHEAGTADIPIRLFHQGIEKQAELRPDHTALIATDATFTYAEMNRQMNRIAHGLIALGVKPQARIALLLPRTNRIILSMFGVMKAGAAYIPCDPEYPAERIQHILDDSGATYIITTSSRISDFETGRAIDIEKLLEHPDTTNPDIATAPTDLAYLIYTSGSTGKPKGVMLEHQGICNYLFNHPVNQHVHAMATEAHITLSVTTISFDMSLKEIGTTLFNGLTLVLANEDQANNPLLLTQLFKQTNADVFNATPSRMLQYMELPDFCEALSHCKVIMSGGEKYSDKLLRRLHEITKARIFNTYGPTEITVSSNCKELTHANSISIGRPLLNYKEFIVDTDGNELPAGVVGELYIGGIGVARGYYNLEKMTQERFIDYKGCRIYKSGDYAQWTPEGDVVILGRTDNQVKLRGLRIELGEIEACITKVPDIKSAVVMIRTIGGREHICAYFTAGQTIDIDFLKEELKKTLTAYMIPTAYLQLDKLPLTPNGKTDLKALPEPQLAISGKQEEAANEVEQKFCDIFAKILEVEKVGATDNFFDMGGTSLVVTRIIIEAANLGYTIAYGDVFSHPTPRALAGLTGAGDEQPVGMSKEITGYDYSLLKNVLKANNLENFAKGERQPLGNVLLTGATGFLGIHILKEYLDTQTGKIYCLMRGHNNVPAENRLKAMLFYYFEDAFEELFDKRIFIIQGDVTHSEPFDYLLNEPVDTVINCAANVKHFSKGTDIEDVNIGGVKNIIAYCLKTRARMIHISTMSVGGMSVNGYPKPGTAMTEQMLYFGQYMDNKYVNSKFIAERTILENIKENRLNAKIMRVGNLSARNKDGEFQINYSTNSFMGRLKAYRFLEECPYSRLDNSMELSPIDEVSKAILLLATTPKECCIFHPFNHHFILLGDIFTEMSELGFNVKAVEDEVFARTLAEAKADPEKARILSSMLAYENMAHGQKAVNNPKHNAYTMQVLYRLGYRWPITSWDYIIRFLQALQGLGFFDNENEL